MVVKKSLKQVKDMGKEDKAIKQKQNGEAEETQELNAKAIEIDPLTTGGIKKSGKK